MAEPRAVCTCEDDGGCIDYYDEQRPGDCAYCNQMYDAHGGGICPAVLRVPRCSTGEVQSNG